MRKAHTTKWDRHAILAEIKRRHGTLNAFAALTTVTAAEISAAFNSPYPKAERAVAKALGIPVNELWSDRYWPNARQRSDNIRPQQSGASQNVATVTDRGAA